MLFQILSCQLTISNRGAGKHSNSIVPFSMFADHTDHDSVHFVLKVDGIFSPHVWECMQTSFLEEELKRRIKKRGKKLV